VQAAWLVFLLLALSLALPGIAPYHQLLQTPCIGPDCLAVQLSPQEARSLADSGDTPADFADLALLIYLFSAALALILGAYLIWRRPTAAASWASLAALSAATLAGRRDGYRLHLRRD
jgi:hypothetical protein